MADGAAGTSASKLSTWHETVFIWVKFPSLTERERTRQNPYFWSFRSCSGYQRCSGQAATSTSGLSQILFYEFLGPPKTSLLMSDSRVWLLRVKFPISLRYIPQGEEGYRHTDCWVYLCLCFMV